MTEIRTLPGGGRLVLEHIPTVRSAAVGFWVGTGARHEDPGLCGISHAMEHMVFKGSLTRSAADVAIQMDGIGGQVNAFTTKECTCFYAHALDEHLSLAIEILGDIFFTPRLDPSDWSMERGVIVEEIGMYEDTPEDLVSERLFAASYRGTSLSRPILGNATSLSRISATRLRVFHRAHYHPGNMVISLAGCFSEAHVEQIFALCAAVGSAGDTRVQDEAAYTPALTVRQKEIEQNHLCLAFPALSYRDADRYVMQVFSTVLGGGMSSRLFQSVRESAGLCYSIYSFSATHEDTGLFGVYTALSPDTERAALRLIVEELRRMATDGPTTAELDRAREQAKSNVIMGLESTRSRMQHNGRSLLLHGRVPTADDILAEYDAVTLPRVAALAGRVLNFDAVSFSAVGQVKKTEQYRSFLREIQPK